MNLLNDFFDYDKLEISKVNKKSIIVLVILVILITFLLFIKKNNYYTGDISIVNKELVLPVGKEYINVLKNTDKIIINDIESKYSIKTITPVNNDYVVSIKLKDTINNLNMGKFKIFLGKESLFDFIIRIMKK